MPGPIPDEWRKRVVAILRGGAGGTVEVRLRAFRDWQALFPGAFEYELRDAIAAYLARPQAAGNIVHGMEPPGVIYEFIFEHEQTLIYGKVGLHPPADTVVILFSAHRPLQRRHFMNDDFMTRRVPVEIEEEVVIPTRDGKAVADRIKVKVTALRDPKDGEIYLTEEALRKLDDVKARHMGLLLPDQIRELRQSLHLKQREISELLQIGEKTWTRWESGRERPSRSLNLILQALMDGKIDVAYLRLQLEPALQQKPLTPQVAPPTTYVATARKPQSADELTVCAA